jgi:DNA-binding MarR family transcriptional regulator
MNYRHFHLADEAKVLATRDQGRRVAANIRESTEEAVHLLVDFEGVEVVAPPFVDELLNELYRVVQRHRDEGVIVVALNIDDDNLETLKMVIGATERPGLAVKEDDGVFLATQSPHLAETLERAQELRIFTAPKLAEVMELKLPNLNQRLARLVEAGALARRRDKEAAHGKRYLYLDEAPPRRRRR